MFPFRKTRRSYVTLPPGSRSLPDDPEVRAFLLVFPFVGLSAVVYTSLFLPSRDH